MESIVITSAVRTPIGAFGGAFRDVGAAKLGGAAVKEALVRSGIETVDEVFMGCVVQAGLGQNIARQVSLNAGIPIETPCMTLNMVCGSGLKAVSLAAQTIAAGDNEIVLAGGTENMSQTPYLLGKLRWGARMGAAETQDSMVYDALTDAFSFQHMGLIVEDVVQKYGIARQEQDEFAAYIQQKAERAIQAGRFREEITPVVLPQKKGDPVTLDKDEYPRFGTTAEALSRLKPAFKSDGTVTAGNASGINDGAAAVVVMSEIKARSLGIKPMARIVSWASAGVEPSMFGIGPVFSTKKALAKASLAVKDIDLFELNEAFAAQSIAVMRELGIDSEKTNVNGGAIAIGHPVGASGARILVTLLHELKKRSGRYGLASLCVGGGMGITAIVENMD